MGLLSNGIIHGERFPLGWRDTGLRRAIRVFIRIAPFQQEVPVRLETIFFHICP